MKIQIRRRLLGFSPDDVHHLLADRDFAVAQALERADSMQRQLAEAVERFTSAEQKLEAAEERAGRAEAAFQKLEGQVSSARHELSRKSEQIGVLTAQVAQLQKELREQPKQTEPSPTTVAADPILGLLVQELAPIVGAARESATAMIDEARRVSEEQLVHSEEARQVLQHQAQSMASWWNRVNDTMDPIMSSLHRSKAEIETIPVRVQEALAPLADLLASLTGQLANLTQVTSPPVIEPTDESEPTLVDLTSQDHPADAAEEERSPEGKAERRPFGPVAWWPLVESGRSVAP